MALELDSKKPSLVRWCLVQLGKRNLLHKWTYYEIHSRLAGNYSNRLDHIEVYLSTDGRSLLITRTMMTKDTGYLPVQNSNYPYLERHTYSM